MDPSPADGTIGSPATPDFESCLSPLHNEESEEFEILEDCFESVTSRSASSRLASPTTSNVSNSDSSNSANSSQQQTLKSPQSPTEEPGLAPLLPEQVRWLYKGENDRKWTSFIGYDSLRIECAYQELSQRPESSDTDSGSAASAASSSDGQRVHVQGGLYEADVANRKTHPIYWDNKGESATIMRGTWFMDYTWQPIEEIYAEDIEAEHLRLYQTETMEEEENKISSAVHTLKFKDFYVEWQGVDKVYLHSEATSSKFYRAVGNKLGLGRGTRLHRTYSSDATMDDKPPDISHLVFVIHGIGQKMDTGSIARSCSDLRETCSKVIKNFPEVAADNKRAEFLPVEWRSSLKLDGDTVESITPNKVRGLRTLLNASAMDILYYTSPLYRTEITHGLQRELNRLYTMFCERHPYFEASGGKISVVAHSLGVVIFYDILMGWNPIQLYDQYVSSVLQEEAEQEEASALVSELEEARNRVHNLETELKNIIRKHSAPSLNFKLENMFCLGSPMAVFLALRGVRPKGNGTQNHILPRALCSRLYNIYHPSDPIAYRLEPLILKHYSTLAPLHIHRYDQVDKPRYEDIPAEAMASATISRPATDRPPAEGEGSQDQNGRRDSVSGRLSGVWYLWGGRKAPADDIVCAELTPMKKETEVTAEQLQRADELLARDELDTKDPNDLIDEIAEEANPIEHTDLEWRLDYQLREGKMESAYLATLTAHTAYWTNLDIGLFLLSQLFPDKEPS